MGEIAKVMRERDLRPNIAFSEIQDWLSIAGYDVPLRSYAPTCPHGQDMNCAECARGAAPRAVEGAAELCISEVHARSLSQGAPEESDEPTIDWPPGGIPATTHPHAILQRLRATFTTDAMGGAFDRVLAECADLIVDAGGAPAVSRGPGPGSSVEFCPCCGAPKGAWWRAPASPVEETCAALSRREPQ